MLIKCMKYNKNVYIIAGAFIALVATYIGFTILRRTHEGLSDGASTINDIIVVKTRNLDKQTETTLKRLEGSPIQYIDLLTSYKNNKMATAIQNTVTNKISAFTNMSDYDEAINYLRTLGVSDTAIDDITVNTTIDANNVATSTILTNNLGADNQAYIDLLTSYKKKQMASEINMIANSISLYEKEQGGGGHMASKIQDSTLLRISEVDTTVDYLRTLAGITISTTPEVSTTRNISLSK